MKFWQHPLFNEMSSFHAWLMRMEELKRVTHDEMDAILDAGKRVRVEAGLPENPDADPVTIAVNRQEFHVLKSKTIEMCPHLGPTLRHFDDPENQRLLAFGHWLVKRIPEIIEVLAAGSLIRKVKRAGDRAFEKAGGYTDHVDMSRAFRSQFLAMRDALLSAHPELAEEFHQWDSGRSR